MTANRAKTGSRFTNVAAQQMQIDHFLNAGDCRLVLCEPHSPARNNGSGFPIGSSGSLDFLSGESTLDNYFVPRNPTDCFFPFLETGCVVLDERGIENFPRAGFFLRKDRLLHSLEQGHVSVESDLQKLRSQWGRHPEKSPSLLRVRKA